jgi:hypothetical protein
MLALAEDDAEEKKKESPVKEKEEVPMKEEKKVVFGAMYKKYEFLT